MTATGNLLDERTFFSIGGGFIVEDGAEAASASGQGSVGCPIRSTAPPNCWRLAHANGLPIDEVMLANECARMRVHDPNASDEALAEQSARRDRCNLADDEGLASSAVSRRKEFCREG